MNPDSKVRHLRRPVCAASSPGRRLSANWPGQIRGAGKTAECTVVDVSRRGAKLRVDDVPEDVAELWLAIEARGMIPASIVWRGRNQIGLAFHEDQAWVCEVSRQRFDPAAWLETASRAR